MDHDTMPKGGMGREPESRPEKEGPRREGEMPEPAMDRGSERTPAGAMPMANMNAPAGGPRAPMDDTSGRQEGGRRPVLVEVRVPRAQGREAALSLAAGFNISGFEVDARYKPVPIGRPSGVEARAGTDEEVVVIRGLIEEGRVEELKSQPGVVGVYNDVKIAPFTTITGELRMLGRPEAAPRPTAAPCPFGTCDCTPGTAGGSMADVARYLQADQLWSAGLRGAGIVVGVVDGGITAQGRPPAGQETARIARVIGGFPEDWGTTAAQWGEHGNMCSTDVLGMAPEAQLYDIRISDGSFISVALAGFQWAIDQHRANGTPHILSNSWGIFQEAWDSDYARNPSHVFTRKVLEAIQEGIIVLFAAGNCGGTCPDGRCGPDCGPGKSIWGANGHPQVITVGAVNLEGNLVGYSSQGPAALDPNKPDFCSVTHFRGYFPCDSGTSAATPIAAGIVALLKQARSSLTQEQIKELLKRTARDLGPSGFDQHTGAGILQAKAAYDELSATGERPWVSLGGTCLHGPAASSRGTNRDVFVISTDHALFTKSWNGSAWGRWLRLGGNCISSPAVVSREDGGMDVFVLGPDRGVYQKTWNGSSWSSWRGLGGMGFHGVAAAARAPNGLELFTIGTDGALYSKSWSGSSWSGWQRLGGVFISAPAAISWGSNCLDVFVIGTDLAVYQKNWSGSGWSDWERLGGTCLFGVAAASPGEDQLAVLTIGTDGALYSKGWSGSAWSGWERLGGVCISAPAAVSRGSSGLDVFVIGADLALYQKSF